MSSEHDAAIQAAADGLAQIRDEMETTARRYLAAVIDAFAEWAPAMARRRVQVNAQRLTERPDAVASFKHAVERMAERPNALVAKHLDVDKLWPHRNEESLRSMSTTPGGHPGISYVPHSARAERLKDPLASLCGELVPLLIEHGIEDGRGYQVPWHRQYEHRGAGGLEPTDLYTWASDDSPLASEAMATAARRYEDLARAACAKNAERAAAEKAKAEDRVGNLWDQA